MKTKKLLLNSMLIIALFCLSPLTHAQVTIGSLDEPNASAVLDLVSSDRGLLLPRVQLKATDKKDPLAAHVKGMTVYNLAPAGSGETAVTEGIYFNDGDKWIKIGLGTSDSYIDTHLKVGGGYGVTVTKESADSVTVKIPKGNIEGDVLTWNATTQKWEPRTELDVVQTVTTTSLFQVNKNTNLVKVEVGSGNTAKIILPTDASFVAGKKIYIVCTHDSSVTFYSEAGTEDPDYLYARTTASISQGFSAIAMYVGNGKWAIPSGY